MDLEYKTFPFQLKGGVTEEGKFTGYASTFGNVDEGGDIIAPGAFKDSIKEKGPQGSNEIKILLCHDWHAVIGSPTVLKEDKKGLYTEGSLALDMIRDTSTPGVPNAWEAYTLMRRDDLKGLSVGFRTKRVEYNEDEDTRHEWWRKILEVDLFEYSPVAFPMNRQAGVTGVKEAKDARTMETALCDAGLSRSEARFIATRHAYQCDAGGSAELRELHEFLKSYRL